MSEADSNSPTSAEIENRGKAATFQLGFAVALIYFNGWGFTEAQALSSVTTPNGFYIENYMGALSLFVRVGEGWYGIARSNPDAALLDAPFLNAACLVAGVLMILGGLKGLFAAAQNLVDENAAEQEQGR